MEKQLSSGQMKRLQALYGQLCAHTDQGRDRASRMAWASSLVNRPVGSFSDLTQSDARHLIDTLQGQLGVAAPRKRRPRLSRDAAQRAGTDGRRGSTNDQPQMVSSTDLAVIENYYTRLGWDRARFDGWLSSPHSPLKRARPTIVTQADANRVRWALKGMLVQRGLWEKRRPA